MAYKSLYATTTPASTGGYKPMFAGKKQENKQEQTLKKEEIFSSFLDITQTYKEALNKPVKVKPAKKITLLDKLVNAFNPKKQVFNVGEGLPDREKQIAEAVVRKTPEVPIDTRTKTQKLIETIGGFGTPISILGQLNPENQAKYVALTKQQKGLPMTEEEKNLAKEGLEGSIFGLLGEAGVATKGKVTKSLVKNELSPLIQEAKKYKSAEEFANSFLQHATDVPEKIRGGSIEKGMIASNVSEDIASKNPSYFYKTKDGKIFVGKNTGEVKSIFLVKKGDVSGAKEIGGITRGEGQLGLKPVAEFPVGTDIKSQLTEIWKKSTMPESTPGLLQTQKTGLPPLPDILPTKTVAPLVNGVPVEKVSSYSESVNKLREALSKSKPLRGKQEQIYTTERGKKIQKIIDLRQSPGGEAGYYQELSALKGEMPKVEFESIRDSMSQKNIDDLFNAVKETTALTEWEKLPAQKALGKMFGEFGGNVPTKQELELLGKVFPKEIVEELLSKQDIMKLIGTGIVETLNVPRSIMSSLDLSAPFRQGVFMVTNKNFWKDLLPMVKSAFSEKSFKGLQQEIMSRPTFNLMKESKLALTDLGSLTTREEAFLSNIAEKIPVLGKLVRGSSRAYTGFLTKLRADAFDDLLKKAELAGRDIVNDKKMLSDMARFVNSATGRGAMLPILEKSAPALNGIFFSPRLMASRINMLNPVYYAKLDPFVRKEAIKTMLGFAGVASSVLGLASLAGAEVVTDPRNADFGKIKVGNTRVDILGGTQQYIRILAQLLSGKIISSTTGKELTLGEGYKPMTRLDILERFFMNKESPIASFVTSWLQGTDSIGNEFKLTDEVINRFVPMIISDLKETLEEEGVAKTLGYKALGTLGFGVQTYSGTPSTKDTKGGLPGLPDLPELPNLPDLPSL